MENNANQLAPQQIQALALLLAGEKKIDVAKALGVSRQTITNWLADPDFKAALSDGQAQLLDELNNRLLVIGGKAADYLDKVLKKPRNQAVGIRAADVALRRLLQTREATEIEQRLVVLEQEMKKNEGKS